MLEKTTSFLVQMSTLVYKEVNFDFPALHQEEVKEKATIEDAKKEEATPEEDPKGIPEFWLTIFKSVDMLSDMLQVLH